MLSMLGSNILKDRVKAWISNIDCYKKVTSNLIKDMEERAGYDEWARLCRQFGMLCKKATTLEVNGVRLRQFSNWFCKLENLVSAKMGSDWTRVWGRIGYAAATNKFILGWNEAEFSKVDEWLRQIFPVVDDGPEEDVEKRSVLRIFFWVYVSGDDSKAKWLSYMVKTFTTNSSSMPMDFQVARLLYFLLGPVVSDLSLLPSHVQGYSGFQLMFYTKLHCKPDWTVMQTWIPTTYKSTWKTFSALAKALKLLLKNPSTDRSFLCAIIHTLFENWNIDSQAACLIFSRKEVFKMFLTDVSRMQDVLHRLPNLLVAMVVVCGKFKWDLFNSIEHFEVDSILDWSFNLFEGGRRKLLIGNFWKLVEERLQRQEMPENSMVELGMFISGKAYGFGRE